MKIPKVTIATITYNSAQFVRQAIESVLAQSFTDFEYLISDDCSTDNTWEIIQSYNDPRIRAWRNEPNLGEYPNRNKTLREAKGDYIIWIDGDDIFYPHGLEFMVRMLDAFPNSAMACSRPYWPTMVYPYELTPEETMRYEFLGSPVLVNGFPDTLFRTRILMDIGGFPEHVIAGDTFTKRQIGMQYPTLLISQQVSWWRRTPGQASSKLNSVQGILETFELSKKIIEEAKSPLTSQEKQLALKFLKHGIGKVFLKKFILKGKIKEGLKIFKASGLDLGILIHSISSNRTFYVGADSLHPNMLDFSLNPYSNDNSERI